MENLSTCHLCGKLEPLIAVLPGCLNDECYYYGQVTFWCTKCIINGRGDCSYILPVEKDVYRTD